MRKGKLVLESGEVLEGAIFGAKKTGVGRLIFDTRVVGYEEVLTDPSYSGKIVCFTYPLLGNYGINYQDSLTDAGWPTGLVAGEISAVYSNFRAKTSLEDFLKQQGICGIAGIDTQYLTRKIREEKEIWAGFAWEDESVDCLLEKIRRVHSDFFTGRTKVRNHNILTYGAGQKKLAVLNFGLTRWEIEQFQSLNIPLKVFPVEKFSPEEIPGSYIGLYLTSGPELPAYLKSGVDVIRGLLGKIPISGYGLGHILIGRALGGEISSSPVNHYGINQPVQNVRDKQCFITEQAHSLVLKKDSLENKISYLNLNDGTIEGLEDNKQKIFSFSFKPGENHFQQFVSSLGRR